METYREYAPTCFDRHLQIDDRENWIVCPVSQTRDSSALEKSNFRTVLADMGGESDTLEIHRFGHWGPGWYEIIIVHPSREKEVMAWTERLEEYCVADEYDYSQLESENELEYWDNFGRSEFVDTLQRECYFEPTEEIIDDIDSDVLYRFFKDEGGHLRDNDTHYPSISRRSIARIIKEYRKKARQ